MLCIGDVIAILTQVKFAIVTLATLVIFVSLLIKLFLKQKLPKQHFRTLFLIGFGIIWSIKIFQNFRKILRCPQLCRAKQGFLLPWLKIFITDLYSFLFTSVHLCNNCNCNKMLRDSRLFQGIFVHKYVSYLLFKQWIELCHLKSWITRLF